MIKTTLLVLALSAPAMPDMTAEAPSRSIADAAWLAGCWTNDANGRQYDEQWMKPAGGTMFGMSRTVSKGRTSASEFLQLREEGGDVFYIAKPSNQAEARFRLVDARDGYLRFENPAHDFPKVIIYTRGEGGALVAQIQGPMNGQTRTIDFPMRRGGC